MPRGGKRRGTPGKGYANRIDMGMDYMSQEQAGMNTPASGGVKPPSRRSMEEMMLSVYPEDIPNLTDPTQRPNEPITDGLATGPGRGPDALVNRDPRNMETSMLKKWLPLLDPIVDDPETPDSVRALVRYIRAS